MVTHSSILAWRTPWTEEPGGLQSMGSQSPTQLKQPSTSTAQHIFLLFVALLVYLLVYFLRHGLDNMMLCKDQTSWKILVDGKCSVICFWLP